jgi:pentatricopeptide repeat protein
MESFQQDTISKCSHLECNDIWACETRAREEGTGIVSSNATGGRRCAARPVTFIGVLNACASILALEEGRCVHVQIIQNSRDSDVFVGSSLVDMYAKCGSMDEAWRVFDKMPS